MSYFKFRNSCLQQASNTRFSSIEAQENWMNTCLATHLDKMENRLPPTDVSPRPYLPYGKRVGQKCRVNSRGGFKNFNCVGNYDLDGKCMPCEGNYLPKNNTSSRAFSDTSKLSYNRSNSEWHYPSTKIGSNYGGLRRGSRGKITQWNLGMGKAPFGDRGFNNNRSQYDWGYFV